MSGVSGPNPPCVHEGPELAGPERQALYLPHGPRFLRCLKGHTTNSQLAKGVVAKCQGCGPSCRDYSPEPARQAPEN